MKRSQFVAAQDQSIQGEMGLLLELCRLMESIENPDDILSPVLMMISDLYDAQNAAFTLFSKEKNEIYVDAAVGLTNTEQLRGRYEPGEGITGRVFSTGNRYIVPQIANEPNFLNRTKSHSISGKSSFLCIPIKYSTEVNGTLSVTLPFKEENNLEKIAEFLSIITTLISQPLVLKRQLKDMESEVRSAHEAEKSIDVNQAFLTGNSRVIRDLKVKLYEYAKSDTPVLLIGDSGTGKTFIAEALHALSLRKAFNIVRYSADAHTVEDVVVTKFFGTHTGSSTSSSAGETLVNQAKDTTLLIEEIDLLLPQIQQMLHTMLHTREVNISGTVQKVSARVILTASKSGWKNNKIIHELIELLKPSTIFIPSVWERKNDITLLANNFLQQASKRQKKNIKRFSTPAIDLLFSYHWPGNLNEMQQVIDHAVRICEGGVIHAHMFPPTLQSAESTNTVETQSLYEIVANVETDIIIDALKITRGNIKKAAKVLKVSDRILGLRVKKYSIIPSQYR